MFGSKKRQEQRQADIKEIMEFSGMEEEEAKVLSRRLTDIPMEELKALWKKHAVRVHGAVACVQQQTDFEEKLATVTALATRPNLKNLAEAVLIQQEIITHLISGYGRTAVGLVIDRRFAVEDED